MRIFKKIITRTFLIVVIIIPVATFAHYIIFPQETRSILIDFSGFKKEGRLYYNVGTPQSRIDSIRGLMRIASVRVSNFWGEKKSDPKFIYYDKKDDFIKYCANADAPAITYLKLGSYIVLSSSGADVDIIAHEISHAEFYERIGFYKWTFKIPAWFRQGLAMQNDYRNYYDEHTLQARTNNFKNMPDIKNIKTDKQFYEGTLAQVMLNYMMAKHEVKNWYTKEKLDQLIKDLSEGNSFDEAINR